MLNEMEMNMEEVKESLELYFSEFMAGGFDEKWLREEIVEIFNEFEGRYDDNDELGNVDDLAVRWYEAMSENNNIYR